MPTKSFHGVTLWAVPRFHRADGLAVNGGKAEAAAGVKAENGAEWVARLKTYSFPLGQADELPGDLSEMCH